MRGGERSRIAKRKPILKVQQESSARDGKILVGLERPLEFTAPTHHYVTTHSSDTPPPHASRHQHATTITNTATTTSAFECTAFTRPHLTSLHFTCTLTKTFLATFPCFSFLTASRSAIFLPQTSRCGSHSQRIRGHSSRGAVGGVALNGRREMEVLVMWRRWHGFRLLEWRPLVLSI